MPTLSPTTGPPSERIQTRSSARVCQMRAGARDAGQRMLSDRNLPPPVPVSAQGPGNRERPVARYYFDIHDGRSLMRDEVGSECDGPGAVRTEAMVALPEIARGAIPRDGDRQAYTVLVRDARDLTVYTATLCFAGQWVGDGAGPEPPEAGEPGGRSR